MEHKRRVQAQGHNQGQQQRRLQGRQLEVLLLKGRWPLRWPLPHPDQQQAGQGVKQGQQGQGQQGQGRRGLQGRGQRSRRRELMMGEW